MTTLLSNSDIKFIKSSLETQPKPIRLDGRSPFDFRRLKISIPNIGQSLVELGDTKVLATVSAEISTPYLERSYEGSFFFNVEFRLIADLFSINQQTEMSNEISKILEKTFKESKAIDTESLCIISGEKVWMIRIDIVILDHGGNLIDASGIATLAALLHFKRPSTSIEGEKTVYLHSTKSKEPISLSIHHHPILTTFALFPYGQVLVDPTLKEEIVSEGKLTISVNTFREICFIQKNGGIEISNLDLLKCIRIAAVKAEEISKFIKSCKVQEEKTKSVKSILDLKVPLEIEKKKQEEEKKNGKNSTFAQDFKEYAQRLENQEIEDLQEENQLAKEFLLNTFSNTDFGFNPENKQEIDIEIDIEKDIEKDDMEIINQEQQQEKIQKTTKNLKKSPSNKKKKKLAPKNQINNKNNDDDDLSIALTKKKTTKKKTKKKQ